MRNRHAPFGDDAFGRAAERVARFFGTPGYLAAQSVPVAASIAFNGIAVGLRWDPYPFILLNLAFSTQAADAASLILLAQTRQADRDKFAAQEGEKRHRELERHQEREAARTLELLEANTALTRADRSAHRADRPARREPASGLLERGRFDVEQRRVSQTCSLGA